MKVASTFFFFLVLSASIRAQPKIWTLDDCIDYALKNNLNVQQIQLNVNRSFNQLQQSRMERLPNLNASAGNFFNRGRTVDPTTYNFLSGTLATNNISLNSSVSVFNGFRIRNSIIQSNYNLKADELELENTRQNVAITITGFYLDALMAKEQVHIMQRRFEVVRQQLRYTRKLVEAGSLPEGELLNVKAQLAQADFDRVSAENQYELAMLNLQAAMLLEPESGFQISEPSDELSGEIFQRYPSAEALVNEALKLHPAVKSAEYRMLGAQSGVDVARAGRYPSLRLSGSLNTSSSSQRQRFEVIPLGFDTIGQVAGSGDPVISQRPSFDVQGRPYPLADQFKDNFNQSISLQLSIPIFNNYRTKNAITMAEINWRSAELNMEQQRITLRNNIYQYYTSALAARKRYDAAVRNVEASRRSFEYTEKRAREGLVRAVDFQRLQADLQTAENNLLQAKYQYLMSIRILKYYLGQSISR